MDLQTLTPIVEQIIKQVLSEDIYPYGNGQRKGDKVASGKLKNSIKAKQINEDTIVVYGPDGKPLNQTYGDWGGRGDVNIGRKGLFGFNDNRKTTKATKEQLRSIKGVPLGVLDKWSIRRGIAPREGGKFVKRKSLIFAIQTNIKKFGIRPSNFIEISLERIENDVKLIKELEKITMDELTKIIEGI